MTYDSNTDGGTWHADNVKPGLYVIAANNRESQSSYSATIVPVNFYYDNATGQSHVGSVVFDSNGNATTENATQGVVKASVKKSDEPTIDKNVVDNGEKDKHGDAGIGDTVSFEIDVTIPNYSDAWDTDKLEYLINDSLSTGLTLDTESVKINHQDPNTFMIAEDTNGNKLSSITTTANSIALDLKGTDVYSHKGSTLTITYNATVNANAGVNFDEETNTATLQYSTTSNSTDKSTPKESKTHHYTFGFDASLDGTGNNVTHEITKYGVKSTETNSAIALSGAQFQLMKKGSDTPLYFTATGKLSDQSAEGTVNYVTTGSDGQLAVTGLDAGEYILKESKAPAGYQLDPTEYHVVITPFYNEDGTLHSYDVKVNGGSSTEITFTHTKTTNGFNNTDTATKDGRGTFAINNTPLSNLPSTGARGIIALSVAAIAMMAAFGFGFVMLKKNGKKKA